ncbi:sensor domain-containing protein [Kitasatospora phosalacinea]|uniref:Sensor domain-containing protein n=1 Tax=Kitasatospora phosalacinea TaxID=2065 RepID=A0ABW6GXC8_9ACTN
MNPAGGSAALPFQRGPLRMLFSRSPWVATGYLLGYLPLAPVAFALSLAAVLVATALNVTLLGLPLLVGAAAVLRGFAGVERRRARPLVGPVPTPYRPVPAPGVLSALRTRWRDPGTWRDLVYLVPLFPLLLALDAAALTVWFGVLGTITCPAWYWAVPDGGVLFAGSGNLPAAVGSALVAAVLAPYCSYLVAGAALLHAHLVRSLLGPATDPLATARQMLTGHGPATHHLSERPTR